jgi:hypothetical protein
VSRAPSERRMNRGRVLTRVLWSNPVRCPDPNLQLAVRGVPAMVVAKMRLYCPEFWVDMRVTEFDGAWLASADTPDGPTLGLAVGAVEAIGRRLRALPKSNQRPPGKPSRSLDRLAESA